jgi:hypothetical protein
MIKLCDSILVNILALNILLLVIIYGLDFVFVSANAIESIQNLHSGSALLGL